jgi:hypothetical protein
LFVALAGLGEPCCKAEGRNEDRVANMTEYNKRGCRCYQKKYEALVWPGWYSECLGVRQADKPGLQGDGRQCRKITACRIATLTEKSRIEIQGRVWIRKKKGEI